MSISSHRNRLYTVHSACRTSSRIDYTLGLKLTLTKYRGVEIIFCILLDHSTMKLELIGKRSYRKHKNKTLLKGPLAIEKN